MRGRALALALGLCACTTAQVTTVRMDAERAETSAELSYVGLATIINGAETVDPSRTAALESIKRQSWQALGVIRAAYAAGQSIDLAPFQSITTQGFTAVNGK